MGPVRFGTYGCRPVRYPREVTQIAAPVRDIVSWDDLDRLVSVLAERLRGQTFDVLLAITRGGMVPAGMLAYRLKLRDILVAAVEYYDEAGHPGPSPTFFRTYHGRKFDQHVLNFPIALDNGCEFRLLSTS